MAERGRPQPKDEGGGEKKPKALESEEDGNGGQAKGKRGKRKRYDLLEARRQELQFYHGRVQLEGDKVKAEPGEMP